MLTETALREEVAALQQQGHRRLLVLTGEHPKYTFDDFLKVSCGCCLFFQTMMRRHDCLGQCLAQLLVMGSCCSRYDPLQAIDVISDVRTEPCGNIRRINVEIPSLSLSDMRRLKATDKVRRAWWWGCSLKMC